MSTNSLERFAMIPESVIKGLRCSDCLRLYALLNLRQGPKGRPVRGVNTSAKFLGWQARTVRVHARHLAAAGIIHLDPPPSPAWGNTDLRVVHNPGYARVGHPIEIANVWTPTPPTRWAPPNRLDSLNRSKAERDAPSGCHTTELGAERGAQSVEQEASNAIQTSASRLAEDPNAEHLAPSVLRSMRSELGLGMPDQPKGSPFNEPCVACVAPEGDGAYPEVAVRCGITWRGWWCVDHVDEAVALAGQLDDEGQEVELLDFEAYAEMTAAGARS